MEEELGLDNYLSYWHFPRRIPTDGTQHTIRLQPKVAGGYGEDIGGSRHGDN